LPAIVPAIALLLALTTGCRSGDYNARVFHPWGCEDARDFKAHVDKYQHVFMVCIYEDHWEDEGPKRHSVYHFKGTVVRVYKGDWRISEKGAFLQGMDYPAPTTSNEAAGSLWFVFTGQHADTEIFLDTGELSRYDAEYEPALERLYPRNMSPVWRGQSSRAQSRESDNTTTWLD
jgi:hypothetical protein